MQLPTDVNLRDFFAAHAMQSILDAHHSQIASRGLERSDALPIGPINASNDRIVEYATTAYAIADAMLSARNASAATT